MSIIYLIAYLEGSSLQAMKRQAASLHSFPKLTFSETLSPSQSYGTCTTCSSDRPSTKLIIWQWALIEMCKNADIQNKLRDELMQFGTTDPTWEQLNSSLPYLDAVVHETLRMHPPVSEATRVVRIPSPQPNLTSFPHSLYDRQRRTTCFLSQHR